MVEHEHPPHHPVAIGSAAASPPSFVNQPRESIEIVEPDDLLPLEQPEAMTLAAHRSINGTWYEVVDSFEEACGLGSLRIETVSNNNFQSIARGSTKIIKPYNDPNDAHGGRFDWKCGSNLEHSECSDSPNGADFISVFWEMDSRNIKIRCFERCGDGSSESDCD